MLNTHMKINILLLLLLGLFCNLTTSHADKVLVNVDKNGVGIQGYDPVAFFTEKKPVMGDPQFSSKYNNVIYHFASAANKALFDAKPASYEPQFGGFCAYGVSRGNAAPIEIDAFQIVNGRLLMQYDKDVRDRFNKDTQGNLKLADQTWPKVLEENGK